MSVTWKNSVTEIAGTKMHLSRAGSGKTVLVLHHDIGTLDRLPFYDSLAEQFDVLVPHHPGWGKSERPRVAAPSARHRRDAHLAAGRSGGRGRHARRPRLRRLDRGRNGQPGAAALSPRWCWSAPMGIKPPEGDIADQAIVSYLDYPQAGFHSRDAFASGLWPGRHRSARKVGHLPRDVFPHRVETLHVQPDLAASAGRRAHAGAGDLGRRRPDRADQRRPRLYQGAAQRHDDHHRRLRPLRRDGKTRRGRQTRHRLHQRQPEGGPPPCT